MYYNIKNTSMKRGAHIVLVFLVTMYPSVSFAGTSYSGTSGQVGPLGGSYVPVYDQTTNQNLTDYMDNFNNYGEMFESYYEEFRDQIGEKSPDGTTDVLRDLISGSNPGGLAKAACAKGDNMEGYSNAAYAYSTGPWKDASDASGGNLPSAIPNGASNSGPYVQINYSHSLRCLLQEVVEWQKLGLSVQIHSLLKTYIADAQAKQLNNQLKNKIAAANLDWSRGGNAVNDGGVLSTQPVFSTNISQSQYNTSNRQLEHITDQAAADPASGSPIGSLGIAAPWRLDTAANMTNNMRSQVEDPFFYTDSVTQNQLTTGSNPLFNSEYDWTKFNQNFNDPASNQGGLITFLQTASNPSNNPIGASSLADAAARGRIERQKEVTKQKQTSSGFVPATQYDSSNPADPYSLDEQYGIDANPAGQNQQVVTEMSSQGDRQIEQGDTLDAKGGPAAEIQSTELNTNGGVLNYDTTPLATSSTVVNKLVQEMYDAMGVGYFGVKNDTTDWARATMLMIYDEMKFNKTRPETVVTDNRDADPTGY